MAFESLSAFILMEGHGPYVWACYGVFFLLMVLLMVGSARQRRSVIEIYRRHHRDLSGGVRAQPAEQPSASFTRVKISQD